MTAADTSVVVAAFASWHEHHERANSALGQSVSLPSHCALECYSVLTRLPAPHRADARLVRTFLRDRFTQPYLTLDAAGHRSLLDEIAEAGITGGATYDALVAATARNAGATLVTCDLRAAQTYERLRVDCHVHRLPGRAVKLAVGGRTSAGRPTPPSLLPRNHARCHVGSASAFRSSPRYPCNTVGS